MEYLFSRRVVSIFIVFSGQLISDFTNSGAAFAQQTTAEPFNSSQTAPNNSSFPTQEFTSSPTENGTVGTSRPTTTMSTGTDAPTLQPLVTEGCLCDLTPDFCDIGCCCDTVDCGVANLSTVFNGCPQKALAGVCVEKWLMFRANVDSSLVTVTGSLFCVQSAVPIHTDNFISISGTAPDYPALGDSYHFAPPEPEQQASIFTRDFYRVDDVILTYFSNTSARGLLRQPSPGVASALCTNRNPTKFLRSSTSSCSREVTLQSCSTDPTLNAQSYVYDLSLIKHPILETDPVTDLLIPVTPSSDWPAPSERNNSCVNVVKRVEFVIKYTEQGEIISAKVSIVLADVGLEQLFLQKHSTQFQLIAHTNPASREPTPAVGLKPGTPVIGRYYDDVKPLTVIGVSQNGACSTDPSTKKPILFGYNSISGCTLTSMSNNCSMLRAQIYDVLRGVSVPDLVAMNSGTQPAWTRVITEECLVGPQESCDSGCWLPHTLSVRVLWAQQGLLQLPQNYILGVKYVFHCSTYNCPLMTPLALSTQVTFVDTTVYPEPPRGAPQPQWKFPFGFFNRGFDELNGHIVSNSGRSQKVAWILIMSTMFLVVKVTHCAM